MFEQLTERIQKVFKDLRGQGKLSEENIQQALDEVRLALLEADVELETAKGFLERVKAKALGRDVALKFLLKVHSQDERSRERFRREARIVARLRHPNVLQVHDFGEEQGHLFLVTEYVAGGTLQDLLRREGVLTPARALELLGPVASALDHLHSHNIIHRDVKPSNILLDLDGAVNVIGGS